MDLLIDTQVLVWLSTGSRKLTPAARAALDDGDNRFQISAAVAFEFADLSRRGRFGAHLPLGGIADRIEAEIIPLPADAWRIAEILPDIHRDPIDRMLIAHALVEGQVILTADATIRRYPARTLW